MALCPWSWAAPLVTFDATGRDRGSGTGPTLSRPRVLLVKEWVCARSYTFLVVALSARLVVGGSTAKAAVPAAACDWQWVDRDRAAPRSAPTARTSTASRRGAMSDLATAGRSIAAGSRTTTCPISAATSGADPVMVNGDVVPNTPRAPHRAGLHAVVLAFPTVVALPAGPQSNLRAAGEELS
jgi:hypothetical protein